MPMYEFKCRVCGKVTEKIVPFGTKTHDCWYCGTEAKKIMSETNWSLKGAGWYGSTNPKK
jgi:putative FmdB family regulatory protein